MAKQNYDPLIATTTETLEAEESVENRIVAQPEVWWRRFLPSRRVLFAFVLIVGTFILGFTIGYVGPGERTRTTAEMPPPAVDVSEQTTLRNQINPAEGYVLPASYGDVGPHLLAAGAIDFDRFVATYQQAGRPLSPEQLAILTNGSDAPIVIDSNNAYFLLNLFWAFGLTNQNPILQDGAMVTQSNGQIEGFASTGGWTIGANPAGDLYASVPLLPLSPEQQARLEAVAAGVYRPCCNNPTSFPDCNHGMALLGMLELMAAHDASVDAMFDAAKYINAFWFPQQTFEVATYFQATEHQEFADVDARTLVGADYSSSAGFGMVHQWLATNGLLEQAPGSGSRCGV